MPDPTENYIDGGYVVVGHSMNVRASSQPPTKAYDTPHV